MSHMGEKMSEEKLRYRVLEGVNGDGDDFYSVWDDVTGEPVGEPTFSEGVAEAECKRLNAALTRRCKTCKHWGPNRGKAITLEPRTGKCHSPQNAMSADQVYDSGSGAGIDDGGGVLLTGPDFGCVHWEGISDAST